MKILAIEDNPADLEILRELLADQQGSLFEIKNARTLAAAISLVPGGGIDFILLDLGLPDSQGIDTLRAVRSLSLTIPIVVLTGFDDEETGVKTLREGAQDYLVKGQINGPSLARSIRYADERFRIKQELIQKNEDLVVMNEEITAISEELRQSNDELLQNEDALRRSEERYHSLFNTLIEGFCVIEVLFDGNTRPIDYRFLEINPAFEKQTGLHDAEGKLMRDLAPDHEAYWFEIFGKIALTGEPVRFENEAKALHRWYEVFAYKVGGRESRKVAILFNDITERKAAEENLQRKHYDLTAAYEEITATQEELRKSVVKLSQREHELSDALAEKEVLLSEIHHRVKNNLTAFISLLSLESTYDKSPAGLALKKDLQNRARSMALIHETLYRTKNYSRVNMEVYLSTLVGQIVNSYEAAKSVKTVVEAQGITLDLSRATPGGLIINELMTNSLKYAFPASFDCEKVRGAPCTISVHLDQNEGTCILTVKDNGIGLPKNLDIASTKTLGLKLVNFLAKHQLRASIEAQSKDGAEFRFRFRDKK